MLQNAPHLTRVLQFVIPCFSCWEAIYYSVGLKLYDWLSGKAILSRSFFMSRLESLLRVPQLKCHDLFGAAVYVDGQFDDARYNLALIRSCLAAGGDVLNYASVTGFTTDREGRLVTAEVEERWSAMRFPVRAKVFLNATGPFSDRLRQMAFPDVAPRLTLSRGVHIVLPLPADFPNYAIVIPRTEDDRLIFAIPWQGRLLVGTTETETTIEDERTVTKSEAEYLLRHLNRYLARTFDRSEIVSAMAGLRPLVKSSKSSDPRKLIRDYEIEVEPRSTLISVLGGKWTVYRAMAEEAIDVVQRRLAGRISECRTRRHPLFGFENQRDQAVQNLMEIHAMSADVISHLLDKFGNCAARVLELARGDSSLAARLVPGAPQIRAEVVYSVREEMAVSIEDVLSRRLGLQLFDWRLAIQAAPMVGNILARELGWTRSRTEEEVRLYIDQIRTSLYALGLDLVPA
ncbi:MAG: FAD-dependent oxidoreductase [Acidobacteriia bacterium]|nr:FAD-dependent oxidoreductase [Terriglobia bacterium]